MRYGNSLTFTSPHRAVEQTPRDRFLVGLICSNHGLLGQIVVE